MADAITAYVGDSGARGAPSATSPELSEHLRARHPCFKPTPVTGMTTSRGLETFCRRTGSVAQGSLFLMRCAFLTWRRGATDIDVIAALLPNRQLYAHDTTRCFQQMRRPLQEYATIAVFWWPGWI